MEEEAGQRGGGAEKGEGFAMPDGARDISPGGWLRIAMFSPGDILAVSTDGHDYVFFLTGDCYAVMFGGDGSTREVRLLGCADEAGGNISWGSIQHGSRLLFADVGEEGQATMTSPARSLTTRPARRAAAATPTPVKVPAPRVVGPIPRVAIPSPRA